MNGADPTDPSDPADRADRSSIDELEPYMRRAVDALDELAKAVAAAGDQLPSDVVVLAEAVSTARGKLYGELIRQGWLPPHQVPPKMTLDGRLREHGLGSAYDEVRGE
jgi:hypothetical protein